MENRNKIFISWKGTKSRLFADALNRFFAKFNTQNRVFFSPSEQAGVKGGKEGRHQIFGALKASKVLIAFITQENAGDGRWMECETAAVYLAEGENKIYPILVDLERNQIPKSSAWAGPMCELQFESINFQSISAMVKTIGETCGIDWNKNKKTSNPMADEINFLLSEWASMDETCEEIEPNNEDNSVIHCFRSDDEFADWTYQYHRVIHLARDLVVRIINRFAPLADPNEAWKMLWTGPIDPDADPPEPTIMTEFEMHIKDLLDIVQGVFTELFKNSKARIWVCLRDKRGKSYYNFLRSSGFPGFPQNQRDPISEPWPEDHPGIRRLLSSTMPPKIDDEAPGRSGQNCTLIVDPTSPFWPPTRAGYHDIHRNQSILGAVLLKKISRPRGEPDQGIMWWILCVNSDTPDVFNLAHRRILQGCNDAFSVVANALLRKYYSSINLS